MRKKTLSSILALALLVSSLLGCNASTETSNSTPVNTYGESVASTISSQSESFSSNSSNKPVESTSSSKPASSSSKPAASSSSKPAASSSSKPAASSSSKPAASSSSKPASSSSSSKPVSTSGGQKPTTSVENGTVVKTVYCEGKPIKFYIDSKLPVYDYDGPPHHDFDEDSVVYDISFAVKQTNNESKYDVSWVMSGEVLKGYGKSIYSEYQVAYRVSFYDMDGNYVDDRVCGSTFKEGKFKINTWMYLPKLDGYRVEIYP